MTTKTLKPEKQFTTSSGIPVAPVYRAESLGDFDAAQQLGEPGAFPYTRGVQPAMYRSRLWTMRQYAGMGDAEESNRRYKFLLANGTKGLSVAFDLPTQTGYDPDDPAAVKRSGPALSTPPTRSSASSVVVRSSTPARKPDRASVSNARPPDPVAWKVSTS